MDTRLSRRALLGASAGLAGLAAGLSGLSGAGHTRAGARVIETPRVSARSVYAFDMSSRTELFADNPDEPRAPGSTAKIATALVAMRTLDLEQIVTIDSSDEVDITIFSNMGIVAGDQLTVEQLLYGVLLPSGSDAARAIARVAGATLTGDASDPDVARAAFAAEMTAYAKQRGATNTNFTNATGDDEDGMISTARDLAILGAELLRDRTLAAIVRTSTFEVTTVGPAPRALPTLTTRNQLLADSEAIVGVKSGTTPNAGGCLVAGRRFGNNRVVSVVLGSAGRYDENSNYVDDQRWDDARTLFSTLDRELRWVALDSVAGLPEELAAWQVEPRTSADLTLQADLANDLTYRLVLGPVATTEQEVGRVEFYAASKLVDQRPVVRIA